MVSDHRQSSSTPQATSPWSARMTPNHEQMRSGWTKLTEERWRTFTTNYVIAETYALFLARLSWSHAAAFLRQFARSSTTIVRVEAADERRAVEIIFQYEDKVWPLTDATSFAVMERLQIVHAFTFDRDFSQYGFISVSPTCR